MSNEIDIEKLALESQVSIEQHMGLKRDFRYGFHSTENLKKFVEAYYKAKCEAVLGEPAVLLHINETDTYLEADAEILDGKYLQPEDSPVKLYTAPPDQTTEIEELTATIERLKALLDRAVGCMSTYCYPIEKGDEVDCLIKEIEAENE